MLAQLNNPSVAPSAEPRATVKAPSQRTLDALSPDDQVMLMKLLTEEADYVDHPEFRNPAAATTLFGFEPRLRGDLSTRFEEAPSIVTTEPMGSRIPTLSNEQEQLIFMRYNFARMKVAETLKRFVGKKLTPSAARELIAWGHMVAITRTIIVRLNLPLVLAMAKRTRLSNVDFNELVSEGNMALLRSVEKFDPSRGFKFSTYACRAILKSFSRVAMRTSRYRQHFPTEFDASLERSNHLEIQRDDVERDCVDELKDILVKNLAGLSDVERTVIRERFAIGSPAAGPSKTLEQVGSIIGVTKERVRQIQNKALQKIRVALEERYLAA